MQTIWLKLASGLAAAMAMWLLYRLRLRQVTARLHATLQARTSERERIARSLHDTLLQSVQALLMMFKSARDGLPPDSASLPLLDRTLQAQLALIECRDELSSLRGADYTPDDLPAALMALGLMLSEQIGVSFDMQVVGERKPLCAAPGLEVSFIVREAMQNAFHHAQADVVAVRVEYGAAALTLSVRDNGKGIATHELTGKAGHWGLAGMRERAAAIGATLHIGVDPSGGTEVALRVLAQVAYGQPEPRGWLQKLRARLLQGPQQPRT